MELRLGELLVLDALITTIQLEEALENQAVCGVRLGSALMEMGYVEENALGRTLSEKSGVPFIGGSELSSIPEEVVHMFSRSMAARYRVMPFKLERNRLGLAMTDPNDFKVIEDISFITGRVVQPYIAPDVHISHARARYYQVGDGEAGYRQLVNQRRRNVLSCPGRAARAEEDERPRQEAALEYEDFSSLNDVLADQPQAMTQPAAPQLLSGELARARSTDEVGELLIRHVGQRFGTGALFQLRGSVAVGWRGVSNGSRVHRMEGGELTLDDSSVVRDVAEGGLFSLGPLMDTPDNRRILRLLDLPGDAPMIVLPVVLGDRAVAVLLVSVEMGDPGVCLAELRNLADKAARALGLLFISRKEHKAVMDRQS